MVDTVLHLLRARALVLSLLSASGCLTNPPPECPIGYPENLADRFSRIVFL
ncbi:MAG: hypothetical protein QXT76_04130 [Sulfolobales archaeon]